MGLIRTLQSWRTRYAVIDGRAWCFPDRADPALDSNMARDSFKTFIPLSVDNQIRAEIIFSFFDLLSAVAAHGKLNGFGGRKLSRMAAWWAFEHGDTGNGFEGGYKAWLRQGSPGIPSLIPLVTNTSAVLPMPQAICSLPTCGRSTLLKHRVAFLCCPCHCRNCCKRLNTRPSGRP